MNRILVGLLVLSLSLGFYIKDTCNNFDGEEGCRGNQTDNDDSWAGRNFQTPPRGDDLWREGYQDYSKLVGYARTIYSSDRTSATVTVLTTLNPKHENSSKATLSYFYNGVEDSSNTKTVNAGSSDLLQITVKAKVGADLHATLVLDAIDFIWNHPTVNTPSNYKNGQKGAII